MPGTAPANPFVSDLTEAQKQEVLQMLEALSQQTPNLRYLSRDVLGYAPNWAKNVRLAKGSTTMERYHRLKKVIRTGITAPVLAVVPTPAVAQKPTVAVPPVEPKDTTPAVPDIQPVVSAVPSSRDRYSMSWIRDVAQQLQQIESLIQEKAEAMPSAFRPGYEVLSERVKTLRGEFDPSLAELNQP